MELNCTKLQVSILTLFLSSSLLNRNVAATESIETAGDILQIALPLTAWGVSHYKDDDEGFYQFTKSFVTTMTATFALKLSLNETRPNGGDYSFPSGHTSAAFSGASFLQKRYGAKYGIPAYIAASFVGYSRVEANAHYPRDVLAGALLAITVNRYFVTSQNNKAILNLSMNNNLIEIKLATSW